MLSALIIVFDRTGVQGQYGGVLLMMNMFKLDYHCHTFFAAVSTSGNEVKYYGQIPVFIILKISRPKNDHYAYNMQFKYHRPD